MAVIAAIASPTALAWSADGHRLIAELAESRLTPAARVEVHRLLAQEPGATMVSVSTWADEIRRPASATLHYVNLPEGDCNYDQARDCENGRCVVEGINHHLAILSSKASDAQRLTALKYVIHLVGDIHQPLHVGLARDKGGNLFQVRAFGRGTNLHAVWDGELIRRRAGGLSQLLRDASAQTTNGRSGMTTPAQWAAEACSARRTDGFYPAGRVIDAAYQARWDATLVLAIATARARLAQSLNEALSSGPAPSAAGH